MTTPTNIYAIAARKTKALKLASALHRGRINSEEAGLMEPAEWIELASEVGVNPPSAETIAEALRMLGDMEDERAYDRAQEMAMESGGFDDSAYRRDMIDAGRGHLLR